MIYAEQFRDENEGIRESDMNDISRQVASEMAQQIETNQQMESNRREEAQFTTPRKAPMDGQPQCGSMGVSQAPPQAYQQQQAGQIICGPSPNGNVPMGLFRIGYYSPQAPVNHHEPRFQAAEAMFARNLEAAAGGVEAAENGGKIEVQGVITEVGRRGSGRGVLSENGAQGKGRGKRYAGIGKGSGKATSGKKARKGNTTKSRTVSKGKETQAQRKLREEKVSSFLRMCD